MGGKSKIAEVISDDILQFDAPYSGGAESTLTIRKSPTGTDILYGISQGQIVSVNPVEGGKVRVKFDDEHPFNVSAVAPSDYSSDVIFLESVKKLLDKIKTSKKMVLEVEFYNEGKRQVEYDVQGLNWE